MFNQDTPSYWKNRSVLVTGGTGFIGSHVVRKLLQEGADVHLTTRYAAEIKHQRIQDIYDAVSVHEVDIRNRGSFSCLPKNFDCVFHLAAYNHVGESFRQVEECFDVNAKGTANLVDYFRDNRVVYTSSSEVYGKQPFVPWFESTQPNPQSPYGVTKYAGELYCNVRKRMGQDIRVVRPFNAYGPAQSEKALIPFIIKTLLSGKPLHTTRGEQTREMNYVGDLVDGILAAGKLQSGYEGPLNLCCGKDIKICDIVRTIMSELKIRGAAWHPDQPYRPNEIWEMQASNDRAQDLLQYHPKTDFEDGIKKTIDWYRDAQ